MVLDCYFGNIISYILPKKKESDSLFQELSNYMLYAQFPGEKRKLWGYMARVTHFFHGLLYIF